MGFRCGIIGLPNVGKTTVFNALSNGNAESSNFPFCTIDPNVGIAVVRDERIIKLSKIIRPAKIVFPVVEFVDIAGLVKEAHRGAGLGNRFLSHIRDVEVVIHVVRCFDDNGITHTEGHVNPKRDIDIIETELLLADLQTVEKSLERPLKLSKTHDKKEIKKVEMLQDIKSHIEKGENLKETLDEDEILLAKELRLLSIKPVIYVANVDESSLSGNEHSKLVKEKATLEKAEFIVLSAKIENEIAKIDKNEKQEFMDMLNIKESGLNKLAKVGYRLLNLISFFTAGPKEVKGWTIKKGTNAHIAAGSIHSDIQRGFIRAEVISYDDYIKASGEKNAKELGLMKLEGKDYIIKDGDVIYFRFNV